MIPTIKIIGLPEALRAFDELPRRVRFKHLRIALNAGGGVIRDRAAMLARRETGLLSKSIAVKVGIPDASYNKKHHGKPAYAVIGVKHKAGRMMRIVTKRVRKYTKKVNIGDFERAADYLAALKAQRRGEFVKVRKGRGVGASQRELVAERKRLQKAGTLPPLQRERAAVKAVLAKNSGAVYRNPSRYAHLLEKGHRKGKGRSAAGPHPFLAPAVTQTKDQCLRRIEDKLRQGIELEARSLAGARGG